MRKLKLLFTGLALIGGVISVNAQTDVTSDYITNADFSSTTGWTNYSGGGTEHSEGCGLIGTLNLNSRPSTTDATHLSTEYCMGFSARWNGRYTYYQQVAENLPAGAYTLTYDVQDVNSSSIKYNMDNHFYVKVGETKYSDSSTEWMNAGASSWTTHTISFTLNETSDVTISFGYGNKENKGSNDCPAIYVSHLKLMQSAFATDTDYDNLGAAISAVENKTLGFDAGEYAPYNYVEVIEALAQAQAIDRTANNSQATVQALTATLNTTMTANADEVNAIWDPSFEHEYSTSGNVQPIAWTGTSGHNNATDVRWMWNVSSNAGLAATNSSKALFTKFGAFYGQQDGYTLPLNAETYYTIAFVYGGWSDCKKDGYVTMSDPSSASLSLIPSNRLPLDAVDGNSNTASWKNYQAFFKTNAAGNYVLGLRKDKESEQSQYVYGDFVLKQTTVAEATAYYNSVKDALDDDYETDVYGGTEKSEFNTALNAAIPSTVAEIMAAAAELQTKHDTYVAAKPSYAKFVTEKTSAIAIGVTTDAANAVTMTVADGLDDALHALYVLEDAAATSGYPMDGTDIFGNWTTQNADNASGEHWSDDASINYFDKYSNDGFSMGVTNNVTLPKGKYVFKIAGRADNNSINGAFNMSVKVGDNATVYKDFVAKGNSGKGIDTSGAVNYGDGTFANENNGRGWEWRFIGFEVPDGGATVELKAYSQIYAKHWVGFSDPTLLTTSDNIGMAQNLYNKAKTAAEAARDDATYAKVDGAEKKALTDAIGAEVTETTEWYQNQTTALNDATANFTATATVTAYNRWDAAKTEATAISFTHSYAVENTTTAAEALDYANDLYTDMFNAKKTAKAQGDKVLGFQDGEYAPYNNTEVIAALNAANAIAEVAATETATLDAAINSLNAAPDWAINSSDVDAIYNGSFSSDLTGWTRTNNWGQQKTGLSGDYATAYYNQPGSLQYGNQGLYTMPLAANTAYALTFAYRSHEIKDGKASNNKMTVSVLNGSDGLPAMDFAGNGSTTDWKVVTKNFKTGAAGNYVLTLANDGNTWITNVSLVKSGSGVETIEVSAAGFATYVSDVDLDFSSTEIEAYRVKVESKGVAKLYKVDNVPAGTPVLLYAEGGATESIPMMTGAAEVTENDLVAGNITTATEGVATTDGEGNTNMILNNIGGNIGFYFANNKTVAKYRAYLHILTTLAPATAGARMVMVFENEETGISTMHNAQSVMHNEVYNLNGQRVQNPAKGLYIVNGRKVVVK